MLQCPLVKFVWTHWRKIGTPVIGHSLTSLRSSNAFWLFPSLRAVWMKRQVVNSWRAMRNSSGMPKFTLKYMLDQLKCNKRWSSSIWLNTIKPKLKKNLNKINSMNVKIAMEECSEVRCRLIHVEVVIANNPRLAAVWSHSSQENSLSSTKLLTLSSLPS